MSNAINGESMKETLKRADASLMADMIKRSRARWAALPQSQRDAIVRHREDLLVASLRAEK